MAVPAYPGIIKVKQADGTVLSVRLHGDERVNFMTTDDGYPILLNRQTGNYEYATLSGSTLRTSGIIATDASMRTAKAKQFLPRWTAAWCWLVPMAAGGRSWP